MKTILSVYGSHNASMALYHNGKIRVAEVERWTNVKNAGISSYMPSYNPEVVYNELCEYLMRDITDKRVDLYLHGHIDMYPPFPVSKHVSVDHHEAHAAGAFYQSPYEEALTFTFDGGGDGAFFNVYHCKRTDDGVSLLDAFNQDLGFPYMVLGEYLADIKKEDLSIGNLVYAGKIMGLCSYGKVRKEWIEPFTNFYQKFTYDGSSYVGGLEVKAYAVPELFKDLGIRDFNVKTSRFNGDVAWDLAATSQFVFEREFLRFASPYIEKFKDMPICLSGGCALNVLLNSKLLKIVKGKLFVPPNTNDCGIAVGGLLLHLKPKTPIDLTYSGLPILDRDLLSMYVENFRLRSIKINTKDLAKIVTDGNIIGIINGDSEHGSRALGNRSIICNPVKGMKDVLNDKVKHREWYRPFAPMVRYEDTCKYFNFMEGVESRHMTFVAEVKEEYRNIIPSVTHQDGTARLQTVKREQNEFIYDLITAFEDLNGYGVLLNTSFNDNGKPILSTLHDAFKLLKMSDMDGVYYDGRLYYKESGESKFNSYYTTPYADGTTVINILMNPVNIRKLDGIKEDSILIVNKRIPLPKNKKVIPEYISDGNKYYADTLNLTGRDIVDFSEYLKYFWIRDVIRKYKIDGMVCKRVTINFLDDDKTIEYDTDKIINIFNSYEHMFIECIKNNETIIPSNIIQEAIKINEK